MKFRAYYALYLSARHAIKAQADDDDDDEVDYDEDDDELDREDEEEEDETVLMCQKNIFFSKYIYGHLTSHSCR